MAQEQPIVEACFTTIAKIYAYCARPPKGMRFSAALGELDALLELVEGDGILQDYLRKGLTAISKFDERMHILTVQEYELEIALHKTDKEEEIKALILCRRLLDGLDLQGRSPMPIPQFLISQMYHELSQDKMILQHSS